MYSYGSSASTKLLTIMMAIPMGFPWLRSFPAIPLAIPMAIPSAIPMALPQPRSCCAQKFVAIAKGNATGIAGNSGEGNVTSEAVNPHRNGHRNSHRDNW